MPTWLGYSALPGVESKAMELPERLTGGQKGGDIVTVLNSPEFVIKCGGCERDSRGSVPRDKRQWWLKQHPEEIDAAQ